ncbi:MAG: O-methyltransferase [Thermoplasmata archaeon]
MTEPELWTSVDQYLANLCTPRDEVLEDGLRDSSAAELPAIQVSPLQGKMLHILAKAAGARRILEIGTLGGYSTTWLGRALPAGGRLITLEIDPKHAEVARANLARAGLASKVEVRLGPAKESLARLTAEGAPPFDFIFIDADKPGYTDYLEAALRLAHAGTLIVADNVVRKGDVADPTNSDPNVLGIRRFLDRLAAEPRLASTVLQVVGSKGYDGLAFAVVLPVR